jgi:TorA maturation chaperone TorD
MRDAGLQAAIQSAGGVSALAKRLGLSQPSVTAWSRVPSERVAAVEAITRVPRSVLRPDLFGAGMKPALDPVDEARGRLYLLLGTLVLHVPDEKVLIELRKLAGDASSLGMAITDLAAKADILQAERIAREHFELFIGVGRGELLPYASYYLTGFLYERPLVRARADLRRLGIARAEGLSEPEDHIAFLLEAMAGLAIGRIIAEAGEERRFFAKHLAPWGERFFADLAKAESADFYRAVGRLGEKFLAIEREAFALEADPSSAAGAAEWQGAMA